MKKARTEAGRAALEAFEAVEEELLRATPAAPALGASMRAECTACARSRDHLGLDLEVEALAEPCPAADQDGYSHAIRLTIVVPPMPVLQIRALLAMLEEQAGLDPDTWREMLKGGA